MGTSVLVCKASYWGWEGSMIKAINRQSSSYMLHMVPHGAYVFLITSQEPFEVDIISIPRLRVRN